MNHGKIGMKGTACGTALVMLLLPLLTPCQDVTGQQEQPTLAERAEMDARRDARADRWKKEGMIFFLVNLPLPLAGCYLSEATNPHSLSSLGKIISEGPAYSLGFSLALSLILPPPSPPASRLLNMPTEYAETYLQKYRSSYRGHRVGEALLGWLVGALGTMLLIFAR